MKNAPIRPFGWAHCARSCPRAGLRSSRLSTGHLDPRKHPFDLLDERRDVEADVALAAHGVHQQLTVENQDALSLDEKGELEERLMHLRQQRLERLDRPPKSLDRRAVLTQEHSKSQLDKIGEGVEPILAASAVARLDEVRLVPVLDLPVRDANEFDDLFRGKETLQNETSLFRSNIPLCARS